MRGNYAIIKIPQELAEKMDQLKGTLGFKSRAEIAKEAIRRFLTLIQEKD